MKIIEVISALLLIKVIVALMLLRRRVGQRPKSNEPAETSWAKSEPVATIVSLHPAARPRRRPF